jgi:hypothetical protein
MEIEQWEYEIFASTDIPTQGFFSRPDREAVHSYLNALGEKGWEMVNAQFASVDASNYLISAILKRRKRHP